ncbi:MAG: aminotransferase class V-fold PLP-dependent enzyme [Planctomycetes bacterium]|nr:aminotransferase class V-fold PLP-dependent enzyme [Planctomycetota bacterium]
MSTLPQLVFKLAADADEIDQVQALHYRTFVEEIPQHPPNDARRHVDRFHANNIYVIGKLGGRVIATLALRGQRPFSLDSKVPSLDRFLPQGHLPVEVRLLAVEREFRRTAVFAALLEHGVRHALSEGFDLGVISGTTRELKLYRHMGFTPFGPLVGTPDAEYQPMYVTLDRFCENARGNPALGRIVQPLLERPNELNFLPGPVTPTPAVRAALAAPPISHRSAEFVENLREVRAKLCRIARARDVQVLVGSASLGNEVIAAQLSLVPSRGLVLANGEFGERLVSQSRRARLDFAVLSRPWGAELELADVSRALERIPPGGWIWFVHHETSTGILNPLRELVSMAQQRGVRACVDCVSSLGVVDVDLRGVHLASSTSGKGLAAYPGLSLVFHDFAPEPEPERLPGYLDLGHWATHDSIPHTHSSNLVAALATALHDITEERMARIAAQSRWLRDEFAHLGFTLPAPERSACPAIVTLVPPQGVSAFGLGEDLDRRGFWTSYRSDYLVERGWLQVALIGDPSRATLEKLVRVLGHVVRRRASVASS